MKKIIPTLTLCLIFQNGISLPLGNPSEASFFEREMTLHDDGSYCVWYDIISFGVGFYGDYVFDRHLETDTNRKVDNTTIYTNAGYLVLSFYERLDIFTTLGISSFAFDSSFGPFNDPARAPDPFPRFNFTSGPSFSWSIGSRATIREWGCTMLGIEGQYFRAQTPLKTMVIASGASLYLDEKEAPYSEWQIGLGLSYRTPYFVPYIGVKYANAHWNFGDRRLIFENNSAILHDLESQKNWGYAIGVTYSPLNCEKVALTAEARFGDERALYVNGQIRF